MSEATGPQDERRRLGDFEIVREIGRGGMGIVYDARQVSLNRKVALKVLASGLGLSSKAVVRFRREAEAAAKLHHTNIVPIYATGEEGGTHFYAMELIEGPSLNVVIRQMRSGERQAETLDATGPEGETALAPPVPAWVAETITAGAPPLQTGASAPSSGGGSTTLTTSGGYFENIARLIAEVADALDYAHNQGVVHRDIKPSNLLLSPGGRLSINDFGLARMLEQPGMTTTGEFMGSPLYMSPEQIAAGRAPLDHRTDIYSLGATLYELLTLQPPFLGDRRDQIIAQIISKEPKPPRRLNKKIPVDLETICLKATEKDPDRRYQTAGQMAKDLRRFVNRFAISAKRVGPITRAAKWVRRRPGLAAALVVALLAAGAAGLLAYRSHVLAGEARMAEGQRALDQALIEAFSGHHDRVEPYLERAEILDVEPGRIRVLRGLAAVEQGDIERAIHELELATQQLPDSLGAHALLGRAYLEAGEFKKNADLYPRIRTLEPVMPEDYLYGGWALWPSDPDLAKGWLEQLASEHPSPAVDFVLGLYLTIELMSSYEPADIDQALAHTNAARTQMPGNVRAIWFEGMAHLVAADIYRLQGDVAMHEFHLRRAAADAELLLNKHGDDGMSLLFNGFLAEYEGKGEEAVAHLRNANDRPGLWPRSRFTLPLTLCRLGRYEQALAELDAMPDGLKAATSWCSDHTRIIAELEGADAAEAGYQRWLKKHGDRAAGDLHYWTYCLLGRRQDAVRITREHFEEADPPWKQTSFQAARDRYICGELSDAELLAAAVDRGDQVDAHGLVGQTRLAEGDRRAAMKHFAEVERAGHYVCRWYRGVWAHLQLERLRKDPTWPPWIPVREDLTTQPKTATTKIEP